MNVLLNTLLLEVIGSSAAGSPFVKYKTGPLVAGDFSPTFTTRMMAKDLDLVLDLVSPPVVRAAADVLRRAPDQHADLGTIVPEAKP